MADEKLAGLFVEIFSKGMQRVQNEVDNLKKELASVEATKPEVTVSTSGLARFGAFASRIASATTAAFQKLNEAVAKVGPLAQRSLLVATASVAGFLRAADPVGVARLQGALGAVAVQLGSIFLPVLDAVKNAVEAFLGVLRSLSDEQKDQILSWAKVVGGIALALAVLPKVMSAFSILTSAVRLFGVTSAFATGGLTALLGLLVAGVGAFALFGDEGESGLSSIVEAVKPLMAAFKDVGATIASAFADLLPTLVDVGRSVVEGLKPVLAVVADVAAKLAVVLGGALQTLLPVFAEITTNVLTALAPVLDLVGQLAVMFGEVLAGALFVLAPIVRDVVAVAVEYVKMLVEVAAEHFDMLAAMVETLGEVFSGMGDLLGGVFEAIKVAVIALLPVFKTVFDAITYAIMTATRALIYLATIMKEIASGNFAGAMQAAAKAVEDFDNRVAQRRKDREERLSGGGAKQNPAMKDAEPAPPKGRHTPIQQQKIEFSGLTDLWKKAMQATTEDPAMRVRQEQLRLAQSQDQKLGRIANAVEKDRGRTTEGPAVFGD